jgi:hypothetical protein
VFHIAIVDYSADDGFISFRYADHLARGQGLVYNIGERVEGYTNFLWVALLAAARFAMPAVDLPQAARIAGTAATLLVIVLAFGFSGPMRADPRRRCWPARSWRRTRAWPPGRPLASKRACSHCSCSAARAATSRIVAREGTLRSAASCSPWRR